MAMKALSQRARSRTSAPQPGGLVARANLPLAAPGGPITPLPAPLAHAFQQRLTVCRAAAAPAATALVLSPAGLSATGSYASGDEEDAALQPEDDLPAEFPIPRGRALQPAGARQQPAKLHATRTLCGHHRSANSSAPAAMHGTGETAGATLVLDGVTVQAGDRDLLSVSGCGPAPVLASRGGAWQRSTALSGSSCTRQPSTTRHLPAHKHWALRRGLH
jgi:hypothetical protein